jgi:hypothetical protein
MSTERKGSNSAKHAIQAPVYIKTLQHMYMKKIPTRHKEQATNKMK